MASFKTRRERKALHAAIESHGAMVYRLASRILGNRADAEDVAQEVFLKFLRVRLRGQTQIADERSWLAVTALNGARNHRRSEANRRQREEHWARESQRANSPYAAIGLGSDDSTGHVSTGHISSDEVWQAAQQLPEELKVPLILYYQEEFKYREIAQIVGCPEGTVATRISSAKDKLRAHLDGASRAAERNSHEQVRPHRRSSSKRA